MFMSSEPPSPTKENNNVTHSQFVENSCKINGTQFIAYETAIAKNGSYFAFRKECRQSPPGTHNTMYNGSLM